MKKNIPARIPEDFCLFLRFPEEFFSQECCFGRGHRNTSFFCIYRNFLQEFLHDRNPCIYSIFWRNPEESGVFLQIPVPAKSFVGCCHQRQSTNPSLPSSPTSNLTVDLGAPKLVVCVFHSVQYQVLLQLNLNTNI